jgi:hypothetical protein
LKFVKVPKSLDPTVDSFNWIDRYGTYACTFADM